MYDWLARLYGSTEFVIRQPKIVLDHLQRRTMEGKTVLCASVTGTVTLTDDKDSEVSCLYYIFLTWLLQVIQLSEETPINCRN